METCSSLVSYHSSLLYIIIALVMISSTDIRIGVVAKINGYHFTLVHRDSVFPIPAHRNHDQKSIPTAQQKPRFSSSRVHRVHVVSDVWADNRNLLFMVNISLGVPPIPQLVAFHTASSLLWIDCATESTTRLDHLTSSTYKDISCSSSSCVYLRDNPHCDTQGLCAYALRYDDGTYSRGTLAKEQLALKADHSTYVHDVVFGCSYQHLVPHHLYHFSGIVGLDAGPLSLINQLGMTRFSYCIASLEDPNYSQNQLALGDSANLEGSLTPLEIYEHRYYVTLLGISVGEKLLEIDPKVFERTSKGGGVMVDSGTSLSYLVAQAFEPLSNEIDRQVRKLFSSGHRQIKGPGGLLCYSGNVARDIDEFPMVRFHFEGANLELDTDSIFQQSADDEYCMAFGRAERNEINVIGMKAQQYHNIGYDIAATQLSIQRIECGLLQD